MLEQKALAYVNMYGILGAIEDLCRMDDIAKTILKTLTTPVSICFDVYDGPCVTFNFNSEECRTTDGSKCCNAKMNFPSPEAFNDFVETGKLGTPVKGVGRTISFLNGPYKLMLARLREVLNPSEENLSKRPFFEMNTLLTMAVVAGSIPGLANNDSISKISAGTTVDGDILFRVSDVKSYTFRSTDHKYEVFTGESEAPMAIVEFINLDLAYSLCNGLVSAKDELCKGNIRIAGMVSMVSGLHKIFNRTLTYLS